MRRKIIENSNVLQRKKDTIDVLFLMDWTGSMSSWISIAKQKVFDIVDGIKRANGDTTIVRLAFVGYRDHCDGDSRIAFQDFVEDPAIIQSFLSHVTATGGCDAPEDVAGALAEAVKADWFGASRILLHFGDAPCHGRKYHDCSDDYPDGDPNGYEPESLLQMLFEMNVDYTFAKMNSSTDKMIDIFRSVAGKYKDRKFNVLDIGSDTTKFLPMVVKYASETISITRNKEVGLYF